MSPISSVLFGQSWTLKAGSLGKRKLEVLTDMIAEGRLWFLSGKTTLKEELPRVESPLELTQLSGATETELAWLLVWPIFRAKSYKSSQ